MKKIVNGRIAEIGDIRLFELAFEGLALNKIATSNISNTIEGENNLISECLGLYNEVYKRLPFPLYGIETNIKYAAIIKYIREKLITILESDEQTKKGEEIKTSNIAIIKELDFWIDGGLCIGIEKNKALKIVGNTWGIEVIKEPHDDNTDLELYKQDTGYKEFKWAIDKLIKNETVADLYDTFMPEFLAACNQEPMIIKWELNKILEFGYIPEKIETENNKIIDIDNGTIYTLDIYSNGRVKLKETLECIDLTASDVNKAISKKDKYINTYGYDLYKKELRENKDELERGSYGKMVATNNKAFDSVFKNALIIGTANNNIDNINITGFIKGGNIIYSIDSRVYKCNSEEYSENTELAKNMQIYSWYRGKVYLKRDIKIAAGIVKEIIYAIDLETSNLKLCRIAYKNI